MPDETLNQEQNEEEILLDEEVATQSDEEEGGEQPVAKKPHIPIKIPKPQKPFSKQHTPSPEDFKKMMKELLLEEMEEREIERLKTSLSKEHLEYVNKYKMTNEQIKIFVEELKTHTTSQEATPSTSFKPSILTNHSVKELPKKTPVFYNNADDLKYIIENYPDTKQEKIRDYRIGKFTVPQKSLRK